MIETALENLKLILTSPRERAPGTIVTYLQTAKTFLTWLGDSRQPTDKDFRRYFLYRREQGIKERTLSTEFVHLQKLAVANDWPWPFSKEDKPVAEEEPSAPAHTPEEIQILIEARDKYSKAEIFYLALSTTWGFRAEEMVRLEKRDYNDRTLKIKIAKRKKQVPRVEHLIPDEIRSIMLDYHPKLKNTSSLTKMYYRIITKAGLPRRERYGWHSIRRCLETMLGWNLAAARLPLSLVADFMSWSKQRKGTVYGGAPMVGVYDHPEILSNEPFAVDKLVLGVHPFLKYWAKKRKTSQKKA